MPRPDAGLTLGPGDVGLVVTDGVTEMLDEPGHTPVEALDAAPADLWPSAQPGGVCDGIMRIVERVPADPVADGQDDRTIVVLTLEAETP